MIASYYFWKWADNDLPGQPVEVHAALLRGALHPALQTFDARPLLARLGEYAAARHAQGEGWDWQVHPSGSPENARFVFVTCPAVNAPGERVRRFANHFLPLGLSGYDEAGGHLIPCLPPKLNSFLPGQFPREPVYDLTEDALPVLLGWVRPGHPESWGELLNQRNGVVALAHGRRYRVEWREVPDQLRPEKFMQWRARDPKRLAALDGTEDAESMPPELDPIYLTYADALNIFKTFLRGGPRPAQYGWCELPMSDDP